ncbi:interferon omega-1-like [Phoca vitulina]|uniref:interferon omega-1-like n=1 Tax=Phoca vitulina TaxID=9720 RepID=UPI00139630F0|nr:interferon omega-1-like [Phoca vitulina]
MLGKPVFRAPRLPGSPDAQPGQTTAASSSPWPSCTVCSPPWGCSPAALGVLTCGPEGSRGCALPQSHALVSREHFALLSHVRRLSPFFCLQDRNAFRFPREMVEGSQLQKAQPTSVLQELLPPTFNLFLTEHSSAAWSSPCWTSCVLASIGGCQELPLLDQLRSGLHRRLPDLDTCLLRAVGREDSALGMDRPTLALKRYFREIRLLEEKKYSDCAWEIVRAEIMRSLSSSANFQDRLGIREGTWGHLEMILTDKFAISRPAPMSGHHCKGLSFLP